MNATTPEKPPKRKRGMPEITLIAVGVLVGITVVIAILRGGTAPTGIDPNLVAILPFRVAGADSGVHYLREGLMDLLAAKLTGEGGPRAADPQSIIAAWHRSGGTETVDLTPEAALELAVDLGAGEVLTGGVVGSPAQVTINASISDAEGVVRARANASGPADSLPTLVDMLAGQLLERAASLDQALGTRSIAALRAYLAGRSAYRRGHYPVAVQQLEHALARDSALMQAAALLVSAHNWGTPVANIARVREIAWNGRDRLPAADRARLEALVGKRFPEPPLRSELLALAEHAVELSRDNPEAWYLFGDMYVHDGAYLGYADHAERARAAFARAAALDSTFPLPSGEHAHIDPVDALPAMALLNQGRVDSGLALIEAGSRAPSIDGAMLRVHVALRGGVGDSARIAASVRDLSRFVSGPVPTDPRRLADHYKAVALLGEWASRSGDAAGAGRAAARLRSAPVSQLNIARPAEIWAGLLDGEAAALRGQLGARAIADRVDSLLLLGPDLDPPAVENLVLAQLYEALGDIEHALAVVRRGSPRGRNYFQLWFLREEARLAGKAGYQDAALQAYDRAVLMLSQPDADVQASFDALKREINAPGR